jgi:hypothetical protein
MKFFLTLRAAVERLILQPVAKSKSVGNMPPMGLATTLVATGKKRLSSHQAVMSGLLSGMACSVAVYECHLYLYPHVSAKAAMRSDWVKIGNDFNVVMNQAREEASTSD